MCGRFSLAGDPFELGFKDNFNITPSTSIPVSYTHLTLPTTNRV